MTTLTKPVSPARSGHVLAPVLILVFAMAIVAMAFFALAGHETRASQTNLDSQRAFWLAEEGRARALRDLSDPDLWPRPPEAETRLFTDEPGAALPGLVHRGSYTVDVVVDTLGAYAVEKQFMVESVGTYAGRTRRVSQRIKMTSFAQYAYFTDEDTSPTGGPIWFITGDRIEGRVHSNGTFRISGNPAFLGRVTSASDHMIGDPSYWVDEPADWPCGSNHPTFAEGFELDVPEIPLPTNTLDLRSMGIHGGIYLGNPVDIEIGWRGETGPPIQQAGWLRYRTTGSSGNWTERQISTIGTRVLYCQHDARIKGVLDGELTIADHENIWIIDDLTYQASDVSGAPLPGCNDLLGLVAENNIVFADLLPQTYDLKVNAVMMALDTSIYAQNWDNGVLRGILTIWGGLIQQNRGAVGTHSGGTINSGYRKNYHYDTRVTARTPPGYPLTGVYEQVTWMETWDESYPF